MVIAWSSHYYYCYHNCSSHRPSMSPRPHTLWAPLASSSSSSSSSTSLSSSSSNSLPIPSAYRYLATYPPTFAHDREGNSCCCLRRRRRRLTGVENILKEERIGNELSSERSDELADTSVPSHRVSNCIHKQPSCLQSSGISSCCEGSNGVARQTFLSPGAGFSASPSGSEFSPSIGKKTSVEGEISAVPPVVRRPHPEKKTSTENDDLGAYWQLLEDDLKPAMPQPSCPHSQQIFHEHKQLAHQLLVVQEKIVYLDQEKSQMLKKLEQQDKEQQACKQRYSDKIVQLRNKNESLRRDYSRLCEQLKEIRCREQVEQQQQQTAPSSESPQFHNHSQDFSNFSYHVQNEENPSSQTQQQINHQYNFDKNLYHNVNHQ